mmetsp:Transcript_2456/g.5825  ORF Transcript_2456/g.5825 Transcript_2456/m.5825 type:complete len:419 (-) Transcript_2456:473-1729(-)
MSREAAGKGHKGGGMEESPPHPSATLPERLVLASLPPFPLPLRLLIASLAGQVITSRQLALLPKDDFLADKVYNTCAIIGNSGLNLLYKDGSAIDEHDVVIRFNSAPIQVKGSKGKKGVDFSENVGRKTTYRFINTQHMQFREGSELRIQQMQSKGGLLKYLGYVSQQDSARLVAFDADFTAYVNSNIPTLPTGGYFALMFAIQKCHAVRLYGFHWKPGNSIPHHYFNTEVPLKGKQKIHDYEAEHQNIEALAAAGVVELAHPCAAGCRAETGIPCTSCAPGSACACGHTVPLPSSLPGFCHLRRSYRCFYKCPGGPEQCPGGPKASRCPSSFDPIQAKAKCATLSEVPTKLRSSNHKLHPDWMRRRAKHVDISHPLKLTFQKMHKRQVESQNYHKDFLNRTEKFDRTGTPTTNGVEP